MRPAVSACEATPQFEQKVTYSEGAVNFSVLRHFLGILEALLTVKFEGSRVNPKHSLQAILRGSDAERE